MVQGGSPCSRVLREECCLHVVCSWVDDGEDVMGPWGGLGLVDFAPCPSGVGIVQGFAPLCAAHNLDPGVS